MCVYTRKREMAKQKGLVMNQNYTMDRRRKEGGKKTSKRELAAILAGHSVPLAVGMPEQDGIQPKPERGAARAHMPRPGSH